ncbi:hypothetical protein VE04_09730, partial [Pseudogymnoascus sp. 24MN13]
MTLPARPDKGPHLKLTLLHTATWHGAPRSRARAHHFEMATMSGLQPSGIVSSNTSSFGQFRLTTFVDAHPNPASTNT